MYRKDTWVNAKAMRSQGMSYNEIANALGINKRTAIKICKRDEIPIIALEISVAKTLLTFPLIAIAMMPVPVATSRTTYSG